MKNDKPVYVELDSMGYPDIPFELEVPKKPWNGVEYLAQIGEKYRTKARWQRAIQSLDGSLEGMPDDVGLIRAEIWQGILEDDGESLAELVLSWANETIKKSAFDGLDEWYESNLRVAA